MRQLRTEVEGQLDLLDAMEAATNSLVPAPKPSTIEESSPQVKAELLETTNEG